MVNGLDLFHAHFQDFANCYAIIGGTACDLLLTEAGREFRSTSDIDLVLCLESIDAAFATAFWAFVQRGRYESYVDSAGERRFYRFVNPGMDGFPSMLELFSRAPDVLGDVPAGHLARIPVGDGVSSLSAILLNDDYYAWIRGGRVEVSGLTVVRQEHLIPLKARAWLDLSDRKASGERVDSRDLKKRQNDVFRLYAILDPEYHAMPSKAIRDDMAIFVERMRSKNIDLKAFGLSHLELDSVLDSIGQIYVAPGGEGP